jgi:hypothetical protein
MAAGNPLLEKERVRGLSEANNLFQEVLEAAKARGELVASVDCAAQAKRLLVLVNGIAALWAQMPTYWTAKTQLALLRSEVELILA